MKKALILKFIWFEKSILGISKEKQNLESVESFSDEVITEKPKNIKNQKNTRSREFDEFILRHSWK